MSFHWQDLDGDGLTTREEILRKEKVEGVGWWYSRWDGHWYQGEGEFKARYFDIDHIVSKRSLAIWGPWMDLRSTLPIC